MACGGACKSNISWLNFHGINDAEFEIILLKATVLVCNDKYKTDKFNEEHVYTHITFCDGNKRNLHDDNITLLSNL